MTQKKMTVKTEIQYQKEESESNFDLLQRLNGWADYEDSNMIDQLPDLGAVFEYWQMITVHYDVSLVDEVIESIKEGTSDATRWNEFVAKHKLNWITF